MKRLFTLNFAIIPLLLSMVILFSSCPGFESHCFDTDVLFSFRIASLEGGDLVSTKSVIYHPDSIRLINEANQEVYTMRDSFNLGWSFTTLLWGAMEEDESWFKETYPNGLDTILYLYIPQHQTDTLYIKSINESFDGCIFAIEIFHNSMPMSHDEHGYFITK